MRSAKELLKNSPWLLTLTALGFSILAGLYVYVAIAGNSLPAPDYGQWLTFSRWYLNKAMPPDRFVFTVPPVYPAFLAALWILTQDPIVSVALSASIIYGGVCFTTFLLAREFFKDRVCGIYACLAGMGQYLLVYLTAFGGLPQLTAILAANLVLLALMIVSRNSTNRAAWIILAASWFVLLFSHTPSVIVFLPTIWLIIAAISTRRVNREWIRNVGIFSGFPLIPWLAYFLMTLRDQLGYATNAAGFYSRGVESAVRLYSDNLTTSSFVVVAILSLIFGVYLALSNRSNLVRVPMLTLVIWLAIPLLLLVGFYFLQFGTDYARFAFYFVVPGVIAIGYAFSVVTRRGVYAIRYIQADRLIPNRRTYGMRDAGYMLSSALLVVLLIWWISQTGSRYLDAVRFFSIKDKTTALGLIDWLAKISDSRTVLAPEDAANWIEALTGKSTMFATDPAFLYRPGQVDRALAADAISSSTFVIENGYFFVRVQQLTDLAPLNPSVAYFHHGEYVDLLTLQDHLITIQTANRGIKRTLNLAHDFSRRTWADTSNDLNEARLTLYYYSNDPLSALTVAKTITIQRDTPKITIDFAFTGFGNTRVTSIDFLVADPRDVSTGDTVGNAPIVWANQQFGQVTIYRKGPDGSFLMGNVDFSPFPSRQTVTQGTISLGEPYLESTYLFEGQNAVTVRVTAVANPEDRSFSGIRTFNVIDLIKSYGVGLLVVSNRDTTSQAVYDANRFPRVYANKDYVVFKVPQN